MPKELLKKELVFLDFRREEYKFYNVEVLSVGYNQIHVIFTFGKLGTKGREMVERLAEGEHTYKEAMKIAYRKIYDKKSEGFISREKMEEGLKYALQQQIEDDKKQRESSKKKTLEKSCDFCQKKIKAELWDKINTWGRGEGNWDSNPDHPLYKKVICLDCQIEGDYFQKKMEKK